VSGGSFGSPVPLTPKKTRKKQRKKSGWGIVIFFFNCTDTLPISPVVLVLNCRRSWPCRCCLSRYCCSVCPHASVQGGSVYGSWSGVLGFSYPCRKLRARKLRCTTCKYFSQTCSFSVRIDVFFVWSNLVIFHFRSFILLS
jgi:hypothetical protein